MHARAGQLATNELLVHQLMRRIDEQDALIARQDERIRQLETQAAMVHNVAAAMLAASSN